MKNLDAQRDLVQKYLNKGLLKKPQPSSQVDPLDYHFIRDLKRRGESNSRISEILHVTEDALKKTLNSMKLS